MTDPHHHSLGRLIYLTSQTIRTQIERLLKPFDLTGEQLQILKHLDISAGKSQNELCAIVRKSPANITRILDRLEAKGLIDRRDNPEDRRSTLVLLSSRGRLLVAEVMERFAPMASAIEAGIAPEDAAVVKRVLARIDTNLNTLVGSHGDEDD